MKNKKPRLAVIKKMPPLHHTIPGRSFRYEESEALAWIIKQPEVAGYLWDKVREHLVYNQRTGMWQGVDYED